MQFENPITIETALERIASGEYIIPVIQRDFVWKPEQVERLFDSLMRGYPIGSFLFWEVAKDVQSAYPFFRFASAIKQAADNHHIAATVKFDKATGILDGQQRLTAFLVGLNGTYTPKKKGALPQTLYLDLYSFDPDAGEEQLAYGFKFMDDATAVVAKATPGAHWFRCGDIFLLNTFGDFSKYLKDNSIDVDQDVADRLDKLKKAVREIPTVNFYLERRDDLPEVLNVFVRLNRGGTPLSYPDLLLSAATVGWKTPNAPSEFKGCVAEMNKFGFGFTRDRVLKAGLVLSGLDIKFKAVNFKSTNALAIEKDWPTIRSSLSLAAELLRAFGLNEKSLTAQNVVIPVAYYLKHAKRNAKYLTSMPFSKDREAIRQFVVLSLVKAGFWTGAVDQILISARDVIKAHGASGFPLKELIKELATHSKSLRLDDQDIDALLGTKYGKQSTWLLLSLIYPVNWTNPFHVDHIVPKSRLTETRLTKLGISQQEIATALNRKDKLANLQLLDGHINKQKSKKPLATFLGEMTASEQSAYPVRHDIVHVPKDETEFNKFYEAREAAIRSKLKVLVTIP